MMRDVRNIIDRSIECVLVCFRRLGKSTQLSDELQRRRSNLVVRRRRAEVVKCFNGSAHKKLLAADAVVSKVESVTRMKTDLLMEGCARSRPIFWRRYLALRLLRSWRTYSSSRAARVSFGSALRHC